MAHAQNPKFLELLGSSALLSYRARLLDEWFDDVDTLCELTTDDMVKIGLDSNHRVLQGTYAQLRSITAKASQDLIRPTVGIDYMTVASVRTGPRGGTRAESCCGTDTVLPLGVDVPVAASADVDVGRSEVPQRAHMRACTGRKARK